MLEVIKDMNFSIINFCCYDIVTLWHKSSSIDLTLMIDLHFSLNSVLPYLSSVSTYTSNIFCNILVIAGVFRRIERDFNLLCIVTKKCKINLLSLFEHSSIHHLMYVFQLVASKQSSLNHEDYNLLY
jgi:hypothetical protein